MLSDLTPFKVEGKYESGRLASLESVPINYTPHSNAIRKEGQIFGRILLLVMVYGYTSVIWVPDFALEITLSEKRFFFPSARGAYSDRTSSDSDSLLYGQGRKYFHV